MRGLKQVGLLLTGFLPALAWAHDGHGDTPWHALMHMIEHDGGWIVVVFLATLVTLIVTMRQHRKAQSRSVKRSESRHDSR